MSGQYFITGVPNKSIPKIKAVLQKVMVMDFIKNMLSKYVNFEYRTISV